MFNRESEQSGSIWVREIFRAKNGPVYEKVMCGQLELGKKFLPCIGQANAKCGSNASLLRHISLGFWLTSVAYFDMLVGNSI